MIQLRKVSKLYDNTIAVNDISFQVEEGETLVLLGTSGCGKTTTLRMINRLTEPSKGRILVNGQNILDQSPEVLRRGIGYVLQHNGLFPHYTVEENICIVPKLLNWNKEKISKRTNELLNKLHLPPERFRKLYPSQLSGGQQQRVGLARALAADPPVLLMDEPFGALDPVTRNSIRKEFKTLDEFKNKTIVMVTHDVQEAFELGNRICLMDKGKVVQIGSPAELLFNPSNLFVQSFLDEHHFQLELQSVTVHQLWHLFPAATRTASNTISASVTVWDLMENLLTSRRDEVQVQNNDDYRQVSLPNLMDAFHKHTIKADA